MDKTTLEKNILLVLQNEERFLVKNHREDRYYFDSSSEYSGALLIKKEKKPNMSCWLHCPNLIRMLKLFEKVKSQEELREFFVRYMLKFCNILSPLVIGESDDTLQYLPYEFLIRIGELNVLSNYIENDIRLHSDHYVPFHKIILSILSNEANLFSKEDILNLKDFFQTMLVFMAEAKTGSRVVEKLIDSILDKINDIEISILDHELEDINPQINVDSVKVEEKIRLFGFKEDLITALNKFQEYYSDTTKDEFDFSAAIGKLREFISKLIFEVANKIQSIAKDSFPTEAETPIGNMRIYLKRQLDLGTENKLIDGLIELVNKEGSHTLISGKEHFRLTRNITIELALLILSKLEKFNESNK